MSSSRIELLRSMVSAHNDGAIVIVLDPTLSNANDVTALRTSIEDLYRTLFSGEALEISLMQKDETTGLVTTVLKKKAAAE